MNLNINQLIKKFGEFPLFYLIEKKLIGIDKNFRHYSGVTTSIFSIFFNDELFESQEWCSAFHSKLSELFNFLMIEKHLCVEANNYAGVNKGEYRQARYLIPKEFIKFLQQYLKKLNINKFKRLLSDYKNIVRNCFYFINYFSRFKEDDYSKALEYYSVEVNNLIKGQIKELKNKNIISYTETYIKDKDLFQLPFKIMFKNDFNSFTNSLEQNIILKLNLIIENLIKGNFFERTQMLDLLTDVFPSIDIETNEIEKLEKNVKEFIETSEYKIKDHGLWKADYCPNCGEKLSDKNQIYCEICGIDISVFKNLKS